jgi:hypothetical protein
MAQPIENPSDALSSVVDSTLALARAEIRLATAEAKVWLTRVGWGLGLLWLALLLTQIFVLLAALAPVLFALGPWQAVLASLIVSLLAALSAFWFAARELRKVKS